MNRRQFLATGSAMGAGLFCPNASATPAWIIPAEEAPHNQTFLQWPNHRQVYRDAGFLAWVQDTIAEIASTISAFEPVVLLADTALHAQIQRTVSAQVTLWDVPTDDLWARDSGPIFAMNGAGGLAVTDIRFNGWGNRQTHTHDARVARTVAARLGLPLHDTGLVGEGGGVEQDGNGLLMAHESSWLHPNRNPGLTRAQITARLRAAYGAQRVIWAPGLRDQDITDYHIDSLARFTGPGRSIITLPQNPNPRDPFHRAAQVTHTALQAAGLTPENIPEPRNRRETTPDFVASYANYYICNGAVIAPHFGDTEADTEAAAILSRHYPGHEVIQLNTDALGLLGGGIHCATQQMPQA